MKLTSIDSFVIKGRGVVFIVESPVSCPRSLEGVRKIIGNPVEIDGVAWEIAGVELFGLESPIRVGEKMGILVK